MIILAKRTQNCKCGTEPWRAAENHMVTNSGVPESSKLIYEGWEKNEDHNVIFCIFFNKVFK